MSAPRPWRSVAVPIYGGTVYAFRTTKAYAAAVRHMQDDTDLDEMLRVSSGVMSGAYETDRGAVYLLGWFDKIPSTLVHETGHLTMSILQRAGINPSDSDGETFCYLQGTLFAAIHGDKA